MLELIPWASAAIIIGAMLLLALVAFRGGPDRGLPVITPTSAHVIAAAQARDAARREVAYRALHTVIALAAVGALGAMLVLSVTVGSGE